MEDEHDQLEGSMALCASCDRCRARKTKCDGQRPCGNCASKYMKKNKIASIENIPFEHFGCVYSPAKRRGPIPGRSSTTKKSSSEEALDKNQQSPNVFTKPHNADWLQPGGDSMFQQMAAAGDGMVDPARLVAFLSANAGSHHSTNGSSAIPPTSIQQQLNVFQQLQKQKQQIHMQAPEVDGSSRIIDASEPSSQRIKITEQPGQRGVPRTIMSHTHLLELGDPDGSRLRAFYRLSIDELFLLPPTPTDEEYCVRLNVPGLTPQMIPGIHLAALSASRFAEVSLGALVHNEISLAMELCNAVVHCLRESVQEPVELPVMFEVAKAYFLLGIFRAYRGDMDRYFKYRRVCLNYLSKLQAKLRQDNPGAQSLLAAVSYLDSWAYMVYNADEGELPDIDRAVPPLVKAYGSVHVKSDDIEKVEMKFNIKTDHCSIVTNPSNKNWIQGAPVVFLNNEAPLHSRVLDALACAIRTCCDQANNRFAMLAKENGKPLSCCPIETPTSTVVMAHENELCSRNIVLSAYTLMQQGESKNGQGSRHDGQNVVISAMDAFLENSDESFDGGFTDSQVQSLLSVCNTVLENPFLLFHAGPTYHMVSNVAIMLCHLLNGMHSLKVKDRLGPMEKTMFEEVLDTFLSIRKLLTIHRRKLPVKLRCHGIPRPSLDAISDGSPYVDLGETLLCPCRGCQGFVLMACSPCVAAERARSAATRVEVAVAQEVEALELDAFGNDVGDFGTEFDLDDDALLEMISGLVQR